MASGYLPQFETAYEFIKFDPNSLVHYAHLHLILAEYGTQVELKKQISLASDLVDQAFAINQSSQSVLMAKAVIMNWQAVIHSGEFEAVNQAFQTAIDVNPKWAQAYQVWADAMLVQAQYAMDEQSVKQAVSMGLEKINLAIEKDPLNKSFLITKASLQRFEK